MGKKTFNYEMGLKNLCNDKPTEIFELKNNLFSKKGSLLYLYYDVDLISDIANNSNKLYFKRASEFSDKQEHVAWCVKFLNIILELKSKSSNKHTSKYTVDFKEIVLNAFETYDIFKYYQRYYICCLSYEPDNSLCWNTFCLKTREVDKIMINDSVYIKGSIDIKDDSVTKGTILVGNNLIVKLKDNYSHDGCICFNKSAFDCEVDNYIRLKGYVNYSSEILTNKFFECLDTIYDIYQKESSENITNKIYQLIDYCNLFHKDKFYSGEKEYRYVYDTQYRDKSEDDSFEKFSETIYRLKFNKDSIHHINITNSHDKEKFEFNFKDKIRLSKISFNEEDIKSLDMGMIYED